MDFETYRADVMRTVRADLSQRDRMIVGALGLCGESGEMAENLKKMIFHGHPMDERALCNELGDVLWYWVFLCETLGFSVDDVMMANVEKRRKRFPEGFSTEGSLNRVDVASGE